MAKRIKSSDLDPGCLYTVRVTFDRGKGSRPRLVTLFASAWDLERTSAAKVYNQLLRVFDGKATVELLDMGPQS